VKAPQCQPEQSGQSSVGFEDVIPWIVVHPLCSPESQDSQLRETNCQSLQVEEQECCIIHYSHKVRACLTRPSAKDSHINIYRTHLSHQCVAKIQIIVYFLFYM